MPSDLFHAVIAHPWPSAPLPMPCGRTRSSSTSSDDMDEDNYDSSSSSSSFAARRYPNPLPTAPLRINRRRGSTSSVASTTSSTTTSPQVSPNRSSFRPLPKVPETCAPSPSPSPAPAPIAAPSPPPRSTELPETPHSARLRRLPLPPIRSPGGDDALLLGRCVSVRAARPPRPLKRSNTRTPDFAMTDAINWDELGDILCAIDED